MLVTLHFVLGNDETECSEKAFRRRLMLSNATTDSFVIVSDTVTDKVISTFCWMASICNRRLYKHEPRVSQLLRRYLIVARINCILQCDWCAQGWPYFISDGGMSRTDWSDYNLWCHSNSLRVVIIVSADICNHNFQVMAYHTWHLMHHGVHCFWHHQKTFSKCEHIATQAAELEVLHWVACLVLRMHECRQTVCKKNQNAIKLDMGRT